MADVILSGAAAVVAAPAVALSLTLSGASATVAAPPTVYGMTLSGMSASVAAPPTVMPAYWTRARGQWTPMVRFLGSEV